MNKFTLVLLSLLLPCLIGAQDRHFPLPVDESRFVGALTLYLKARR